MARALVWELSDHSSFKGIIEEVSVSVIIAGGT